MSKGTMNVRELIEKLQSLDINPDSPVVCSKDGSSVFSIVDVQDIYAAIDLLPDGTPSMDFGGLPGDYEYDTAKAMIVISDEVPLDF